MTKLDETGLFQHSTPRLDACSICDSRRGPFRFEDRRTGRDFHIQRWAFCRKCFQTYQGNGDQVGIQHLILALFAPENLVDIYRRGSAG